MVYQKIDSYSGARYVGRFTTELINSVHTTTDLIKLIFIVFQS